MKSLKKVKQVVIGGGYNDLVEGRKLSEISHSWREALSVVPEPVKIVCVGIPSGRGALPSRADDISKLNQMLREICELRKSKFLYAGTENPAFSGVDAFSQDGIHLVPEATRILANLVKVALE